MVVLVGRRETEVDDERLDRRREKEDGPVTCGNDEWRKVEKVIRVT
jgi:hypothetical protein